MININKIVKRVVELLIILLFYLFQVTLARAISIAYISPNWLIVLPVFFGFFSGKNEGMFVGFFAGFMYDLFFSSLFGFSSLVFIYIGYFSGVFYQKYEVKEILIPLALVIISSFGFSFLCYVGNFLLQNRLNLSYYLSRFILPETVYTALVALFVYYPINMIVNQLDKIGVRKNKGSFDEGSI